LVVLNQYTEKIGKKNIKSKKLWRNKKR
jgi:hypothetical protein